MTDNNKAPSFFSVVQSTLAAAFGVQSDRKRRQDFAGGHPGYYILSGIVFTAVFVGVLALIVSQVVD